MFNILLVIQQKSILTFVPSIQNEETPTGTRKDRRKKWWEQQKTKRLTKKKNDITGTCTSMIVHVI